MAIHGSQPGRIVKKKGLGSYKEFQALWSYKDKAMYDKDKNHKYIKMQNYIKALKCFIKKTLIKKLI